MKKILSAGLLALALSNAVFATEQTVSKNFKPMFEKVQFYLVNPQDVVTITSHAYSSLKVLISVDAYYGGDKLSGVIVGNCIEGRTIKVEAGASVVCDLYKPAITIMSAGGRAMGSYQVQ